MAADEVNGNDWRTFQPDRSGGATDKGPRRTENQDAYWIPDERTPTELGALYLVADGVGGQQDGAIASKLAVEVVQGEFYDLRRQGQSIAGALKLALEKANQAIQEEAQQRQVRKMGSTFVAAVQDGDKLRVAHVGDARAYLLRREELRQLTRDDTWVQRQVDAGLLTEEEAAGHEFRNVVTQVLGNKPEITINLSQEQLLQPNDAIMLCSDGLYDALSDSRMVTLISENTAQQAAEKLVQAAVEAEATDNITAVVVRAGDVVPLAAEPTLAPLAAAAAVTVESAAAGEPTLTDGLVAPESEPTIMTPPPPLPVTKPKDGGISKWLIILAVVAVLLIAGALGAFWMRNRNVVGDSQDAAATSLPAAIEEPTATSTEAPLRSVAPTGTTEALVPTEVPTEMLTETPTETPTTLPDTPTPRPTSTAEELAANRACVNEGLNPFVWEENQIRTGNCDVSFVGLDAGDEVIILSEEALLGEGLCGSANFLRVQLADEVTTVGWIREDLLDPLEPDQSCGQ